MIDISVGIPVYNVSPYVEKSLLSVLNQDFKGNIEVLVIDDCGSDDSMDLIRRIVTVHPRGSIVREIKHATNKGLGPSRNTAIDNAEGKYIFFLDSDDWIAENCLSILYATAESKQAEVTVGSVLRKEENGNIKSVNLYPYTSIVRHGAGVYMVGHGTDCHIEVWNKLFRTDFIRKNKICFIHRIFEDYYFDFRWRACATKVVLCPEITLFYNIRKNSILTTLAKQHGSDESVVTFCEIIKFLQQMLINEFSGVEGIYDLYFQRMIWVMENFKRYHYSDEQWKTIKEQIGAFMAFVPSVDVLKVPRHRYLFSYCQGKDDIEAFYRANDISLHPQPSIPTLRQRFNTFVYGFLTGRLIQDWLEGQNGKLTAKKNEKFKLDNQSHSFDYPAENKGWQKVGTAPVWGNRETGTMFDPFVYYDNNRFKMVVSERKFGNLILIDSEDGITWGTPEVLLTRRYGSWEHIVNRGCMLRVDDTWHLWYTGQSPEVSSIGHAVSRDGLNFRRLSLEPCLQAELPQEGLSVMNPCVIWDDVQHIFKMWYAAGENYEPDMIFYAESTDGQNWKKHKSPVLAKHIPHEWEKSKVGGCDVKKLSDGSYLMYYIGYQNVDVARICYATSVDGIIWNRPENNLVLSPSRDSWDSDAIYKPTVVERNGVKYIWYNGRRENEEYIGLAYKEKNEEDFNLGQLPTSECWWAERLSL